MAVVSNLLFLVSIMPPTKLWVDIKFALIRPSIGITQNLDGILRCCKFDMSYRTLSFFYYIAYRGKILCVLLLIHPFMDFVNTHTQWLTWQEDDRKDWILWCCKFYMSYGTLSWGASLSYRHISLNQNPFFFYWSQGGLVKEGVHFTIFFTPRLMFAFSLHSKINVCFLSSLQG